MSTYLIPGVMGLLTGLLLHWGMFYRSDGLRSALGLRRSLPLRTGLTALGWGLLLTALLMWLAVIDVDGVEVLPLSFGVLAGGVVFGIAAALCGFTPTTAFAGLGAGNAPEALCALLGCFAGTQLLPPLSGLLTPLRTAAPYIAATLFKVTLDEPFLLSGGFLGLGCTGGLLAVIALCIPSPRPLVFTDKKDALPPKAPAIVPEEVPEPDDAPEETVVAALEGEEVLVIDTTEAEPGAADEENPSE